MLVSLACFCLGCSSIQQTSIKAEHALITSNKATNHYDFAIASRTTINELLVTNNILNFVGRLFADDAYVLPDPRWIEEQFLPNFTSFTKALGIDKYQPEINDCDDMARTGAFFGHYLFKKTFPDYKKPLAMGEFWYEKEIPGVTNNTGHAINFFVVFNKADKTIGLVFFDPQMNSIVKLSQTEMASVIAWRL